MIRLIIADDHAIVRRGLKTIVEDEHDLKVGAEASNAQELLDLVRKKSWDAVVLDINMPGRSGIEVLKEIKQEKPKLPILVLTMHAEEQFGIRALRAGASGYLTKDSAPTELVAALRKVLAGGRYVTSSLAEKLAVDLGSPGDRPPHETLSDREYQVLRLLASGKTASQVADKLALSVKTISTYRARILEKLHLTTTAELMRYAVDHKLTE